MEQTIKENINKSLSNSKIRSLNTNLSGATNNWQASSKSKAQSALTDIANKEDELKKIINNYFTICDLIKDYKEIESKIDDYNDEVSYLNSQIKKAKKNDKPTSSYEKDKKKYNNKISGLKDDLAQIEKKVKNLI